MNHPFVTGLMEAHGRTVRAADLDWNPHPAFNGVRMKHLLTGSDTSGALSLHLVSIDPDCAIGDHVHADQDELHLVLEGAGTCLLNQDPLAYAPGAGRFLPKGEPHEVRARDRGLLLAAVFTPALL